MYDLQYFEKMLRQNSKTAEEICKIRWEFIRSCGQRVLDYGSGVGWFRAFRPEDKEVDSYDIGPYPQTGIRNNSYDVICLWDVLEHLPSFEEMEDIFTQTSYVAVSIPIKPAKTKIENWKHFKPGEHLHYFTVESLDAFFKKYDFKKVKSGYPECPPREDILNILYEKNPPKEWSESRRYSDHDRFGRGLETILSGLGDRRSYALPTNLGK
jgi:hypothetical protein